MDKTTKQQLIDLFKESEWSFSVFTDNTFTYEIIRYEQNEIRYNIHIIADDMFFREETINDLFNKKNIIYFNFQEWKVDCKKINNLTFIENEN